MIEAWAKVVFGLVLLLTGAEALVRGASAVALRLRMTPSLVGLTVVALGTSLPELVISIMANFRAKADLAVGTIVGSNFFNLGLILGVGALIRPLAVENRTLRAEYPVMLFATVGAWLLARDGVMDRGDGVLLIAGASAVIALLGVAVRKGWVASAVGDLDELEDGPGAGRAALYLVVGAFFLWLGAEWSVAGASYVATEWGWSERIIGLTIVAFGTSAPELAVSVVAAVRRQAGIAIGNVVGSCILNLLLVWGVTASIGRFAIADVILGRDFPWLLGLTIGLFPLIFLGRSLSRFDGVILLVTFAVYYGLMFAS